MLQKQKYLLEKVGTIVKHNRELAEAKGELFNIYNILNLNTKEVRTHSAFIAELLNPKGSHFMGTQFLNAFLDILPKDYFETHLDSDTTSVTVEFHTGIINKELKIGGRIDILLKDGNGNTITIENKIDAGDQDFQILRYFNYNRDKNRVIYISKYGDEPNDTSIDDLISNKDYHILSYKEDIIGWLQTCQSIAFDQPILRESIKQYRILIQQITQTLGNQEDLELTKVVKDNLEEASAISSKYQQVVKGLKESLRKKVMERVSNKISGFELDKNYITSNIAHIWFYNKELEAIEKVWFAVESFSGSGHKDGLLFVGIFDRYNRLPVQDDFQSVTKSWIHHRPIMFENTEINLSNMSFLKVISNSEKLEEVAEDIADQIIAFINDYRYLLEK